MNTSASTLPVTSGSPLLQQSIDAALKRIPPLWPLQHFVAVNPFLGFTHLPFADACAPLQRVYGRAPVLSPSDYLNAYVRGEIQRQDILAATDATWSADDLVHALDNPDASRDVQPIATVR